MTLETFLPSEIVPQKELDFPFENYSPPKWKVYFLNRWGQGENWYNKTLIQREAHFPFLSMNLTK